MENFLEKSMFLVLQKRKFTTVSANSRVAYVIPFDLGLLANSIMRFYRFWAGKK
jgi:hypothetical protein